MRNEGRKRRRGRRGGGKWRWLSKLLEVKQSDTRCCGVARFKFSLSSSSRRRERGWREAWRRGRLYLVYDLGALRRLRCNAGAGHVLTNLEGARALKSAARRHSAARSKPIKPDITGPWGDGRGRYAINPGLSHDDARGGARLLFIKIRTLLARC